MVLVSIITPTYNSAEFIRSTYESIVHQSITNWEWIVTDDCSTDATIAILEDIELNDSRVKIFKNDNNSGAAVSRNNSLRHASGEFIAFVDSDDMWQPNKLEKQLAFMSSNVDFSFTAFELVDESGCLLNKKVDSNQNGAFNYHDMLKKKATLGCSTVMIRREAFSDITMPLIRTGQDYALWLKLLKSKNAFALNDVLTLYRIQPNSISRNKVKKAKRQWQIYREIEGLSLVYSFECFIYYAFRAVFRK